MSAHSNLDIKGKLSDHPLAELLIETTEARLSGSFRLAREAAKTVIYLNSGKVVFAASNLRQHRLFELLINEQRLTSEQITSFENFGNDMELADQLVDSGEFTRKEIDGFLTNLIEMVIGEALAWEEGDWNFSPLIRIRESINYDIDLHRLLLERTRRLGDGYASWRISSDIETFGLKPAAPTDLVLEPAEGFLLSRFEDSFLKLSEILAISGLPEETTKKALYCLWIGGFLYRQHWNAAFPERTISRIQSADLRLKQEEEPEPEEAAPVSEPASAAEETAPAGDPEPVVEEPEMAEPIPEIDEEERLRQYLERVESADNLYEVIGAFPDDTSASIKQKYFAQAKLFHPDLFHRNEEIHRRVQNAFTELAHAYDTLKSEKSRELYDFRMRKELASMKKKRPSASESKTVDRGKQAELAEENFENGQELLMHGEYAESLPFFARAVHFDHSQARYHAFYGKALSSDKKQQHKAEAELQTAVRLEPNNTTYRLMLAELFVDVGLLKRAEGELRRLLDIAPHDREALALLDSLQKK